MGQWFHYAQTYDGANIRVYINGGLTNTFAFAGRTASTGPLYISGRGVQHPFNGLIDEVEIFDRTLSPAEVTARYNSGPASGMVAWYKGENNANDQFGVNNGTFSAGTFVTGKVGQAFDLDGADDYVQIPDSASFNATHAVSILSLIHISEPTRPY